MAGFLPILFASTGMTPQAAPDAASQPQGAEGVFAAVLAQVSGDAGANGRTALPLTDEAAFAAPFAGEPAAPVLAVETPALPVEGAALAQPAAATGLATILASLSTAPAAPAPAAAEAEADATPGQTPVVVDPAAVARPRTRDAAEAGADPEPRIADAEVRQPVTPKRQPKQARQAVGPQEAEVRPAVEAGQVLPAAPAEPAIAANKPEVREVSLTIAIAPEGGVAEPAAEPAALAAAPLMTAAAPAETDDAPVAASRPAARPDIAMAAAPRAPQPAEFAAAPEAAALPGADTETPDAARIDQTAPDARTQAPAETRTAAAAAPTNPAPADVAVLAALAPAAGRVAPAPRVAGNRTAAEDTPALNISVPQAEDAAAHHAAAPAPARRTTVSAEPAAAQPQQPLFDALPDAAPRVSDKAPADAAQPAQAPVADRIAAVTAEQPAAQPAAPQAVAPEGIQPLAAQPAAQPATTAGTLHAQPHPVEHVRVTTPQQVPEAVGLAISRQAGSESTEFTLRLDPAELGRIEVKLEMGQDGRATVSVQADNASTFDLLRRDAHVLERALAEAGLKLDSGGLNFSLRQQDGQNQQGFNGEGAPRFAGNRMQDAGPAASEPDSAPRPGRRSAAGLLDLSI